jgi:hypothetical protein
MFSAGGFKWTMREYFQYCSTQHDEIPLYLFDKSCFDHTNIHNDFSIPQYFDDDMLRYLGEDRPDYRWIIIGARRFIAIVCPQLLVLLRASSLW